MGFDPDDKKIKEISDHLSSLPVENQRLLFITSFLMGEDIHYRTRINRDGKRVKVELLTKNDSPLTEKEAGVAFLQSAASFLIEAAKKLELSLNDLIVYLYLIAESAKG